MTFVCMDRWGDFVWCCGTGHIYAKPSDHERWAIAKIWEWYGRCLGYM